MDKINCEEFINKEIKVVLTTNAFREFRKYMFNHLWLKISTILLLIFLCVPIVDLYSGFILVILYVFFIINLFIILKLIDITTRKNHYSKISEKVKDNIICSLYFFEDYFEIKNMNFSKKIEYRNIWKFVETNNMFYLFLDKKACIPIFKSDYSNQLLNFITTMIINNSSLRLNKVSIQDKLPHKKARTVLSVLFILSIISIWAGIFSIIIISKINHIPTDLMLEYTWYSLIALPIPVLSFVLGILFNKKVMDCKRNITVGLIASLVLIFIAAISSAVNFELDYSNVYRYEYMIKVKFPSEGKFYRIEWDDSYLKEHKTNYIRFLDRDVSKEMYQNIQKSETWLLKDNIGSNLNSFIPKTMVCESTKEKCYYSIYISELNVHNSIPEESKKYHVYSMMYDPSTYTLTIEEFVFDYRA